MHKRNPQDWRPQSNCLDPTNAPLHRSYIFISYFQWFNQTLQLKTVTKIWFFIEINQESGALNDEVSNDKLVNIFSSKREVSRFFSYLIFIIDYAFLLIKNFRFHKNVRSIPKTKAKIHQNECLISPFFHNQFLGSHPHSIRRAPALGVEYKSFRSGCSWNMFGCEVHENGAVDTIPEEFSFFWNIVITHKPNRKILTSNLSPEFKQILDYLMEKRSKHLLKCLWCRKNLYINKFFYFRFIYIFPDGCKLFSSLYSAFFAFLHFRQKYFPKNDKMFLNWLLLILLQCIGLKNLILDPLLDILDPKKYWF